MTMSQPVYPQQPNFRLIMVIVAVVIVGAAFYFSMIGFGLPSEKDPLSIRQESPANVRNIRGGTRNFGK